LRGDTGRHRHGIPANNHFHRSSAHPFLSRRCRFLLRFLGTVTRTGQFGLNLAAFRASTR
jgi:hypothetical protein